jgi:nucleotide sugar dehydrogenase
MRIGIVGYGFVGKATSLFSVEDDFMTFDLNNNLCNPKNITINDLEICDVLFVSVPTPMNSDGTVHTGIVEKVVDQLKKIKIINCPIIVRSTVPPGTCEKLGVFFMPEFLTEKNFMDDFKNNKKWIIGCPNSYNENELVRIMFIIDKAYEHKKINSKKMEIVTTKEAEMIKYFKNTFLAVKVSYCNEIKDFCDNRKINYNKVVQLATEDDRITSSHTSVPGHDGKKGYGGTCFPKDINGLYGEFKKYNIPSYLLESSIKRNEEIDRPSKDWTKNKGRTVL